MKVEVDKILHVETSALMVLISTAFLALIMPKGLAIVLSAFASFAAGFSKEYYDYASGTGTADRKDVRADAVGVALGVLLCVML